MGPDTPALELEALNVFIGAKSAVATVAKGSDVADEPELNKRTGRITMPMPVDPKIYHIVHVDG